MHDRDDRDDRRDRTTGPRRSLVAELHRCVEETLADLARSIDRGLPMTPANLRRAFERRWWRAARGAAWTPDAHRAALRHGVHLVARGRAQTVVPFDRRAWGDLAG